MGNAHPSSKGKLSNAEIENAEPSNNIKGSLPAFQPFSDPEELKRGRQMFGPPTEILPFLLLGSNYNAVHPETIEEYGITHILNVADECEVVMRGATCKKIVVEDQAETYHQRAWEQCFHFIEEVRKKHEEHVASGKEKPHRVLVHCARGRSRSTTIIIAYLMHHHNLSLKEAYVQVKEKRRLIGPHYYLKLQLITFEREKKEFNSMYMQEWAKLEDEMREHEYGY